jgi:DNA primase
MLRLRDDKRKEQEREDRRKLPVNPDIGPVKREPAQQTVMTEKRTPVAIISQGNQREYTLMQMLVRHGEKYMCQVKGEDGKDIPLTVIEYIHYSLADDGILLSDPLYQRILKEGMEHVKEDGFRAEHYFVNHPDPAMSKLAVNLSVDNVPLSRVHGNLPEDERLDVIVPNLMAGLRLGIVQSELKAIIEKTRKPEIKEDKEALRKLMTEFSEKTKLAKQLAKDSGERVILK